MMILDLKCFFNRKFEIFVWNFDFLLDLGVSKLSLFKTRIVFFVS